MGHNETYFTRDSWIRVVYDDCSFPSALQPLLQCSVSLICKRANRILNPVHTIEQHEARQVGDHNGL